MSDHALTPRREPSHTEPASITHGGHDNGCYRCGGYHLSGANLSHWQVALRVFLSMSILLCGWALFCYWHW